MAFRIVSIENPAEVHVRDGQLVVIQDKGTASIPVKDIKVLIVSGPSIRMSTMAQTILANNKVVTLFLGRNHHPAAMLLPIVAHSRQARVIQDQASMSPHLRGELWRQIIVRKIDNQARALAILGLPGSEELWEHSLAVLPADADNREGMAAKLYFQYLQPGFNRRVEDPLNSALNYGYAIVRAVMAQELVSAGFEPALGLHHCSQLNPFNLVDDAMEPLRPSIDLLACQVAGKTSRLSRKQRSALREAVRLSVDLGGRKASVLGACRRMAESLRTAVRSGRQPVLALPTVRQVELMPVVEE